MLHQPERWRETGSVSTPSCNRVLRSGLRRTLFFRDKATVPIHGSVVKVVTKDSVFDKIRAGDSAALAAWFEQEVDALYLSVCPHVGFDAGRAEDVVLQTFEDGLSLMMTADRTTPWDAARLRAFSLEPPGGDGRSFAASAGGSLSAHAGTRSPASFRLKKVAVVGAAWFPGVRASGRWYDLDASVASEGCDRLEAVDPASHGGQDACKANCQTGGWAISRKPKCETPSAAEGE